MEIRYAEEKLMSLLRGLEVENISHLVANGNTASFGKLGKYMAALTKKVVADRDVLQAQLAASEAERDRYKVALEHYADEGRWGMTVGSLSGNRRRDLYYPSGNGYDIAREALKQE